MCGGGGSLGSGNSLDQFGNFLERAGDETEMKVSDTLGHWGRVTERFWYDFQREMAQLTGQKPPDKAPGGGGSQQPLRMQQGSAAEGYGRNLADSPMGMSKAVGADMLDSTLPSSGTLL